MSDKYTVVITPDNRVIVVPTELYNKWRNEYLLVIVIAGILGVLLAVLTS